MPLDIWFEIVSHLTPKDLLTLCRTTRQFREMLVARKYRHLWAAARRNVPGLPDPPKGISELRYAETLFSTFCMGCSKRAQKYDIYLMMRYCASCRRDNVMFGFMLQQLHGLDWDDPIFDYIPASGRGWESHELGRLMQEEEKFLGGPVGNINKEYLVADFEAVVARLEELEEAEDESALDAFIHERKQYVQAMREFSSALEKWERSKIAAKADLERAREASIKQKLIELGYKESDFPYCDFYGNEVWCAWLDIVNQPKELTPRIWKNIRPKLEELLVDEKFRREGRKRLQRREAREEELRHAYSKLLRTAPVEDGPFPAVSKVIALPEVQALIKEDDIRIPMTEERLSSVMPKLLELARRNKAELVKAAWAHFVGLSVSGDKAREAAVDVQNLTGVPQDIAYGSEMILQLATALFRCYFCVDRHGKPAPGCGDAVYNITELAQHIHTEHARAEQTPVKVRVDSAVAQKVLSKLGLPEDVRYSEVSGRIVCTCATFSYPTTFAQLVSHIMWETSFYHAVSFCRGASAGPKDEALIHDHDLDKDASFLRLLQGIDTFEQTPLSTAEAELAATWSATFGDKKVVCTVCKLCTAIPDNADFWWQGGNRPYVPAPPPMAPDVLVRHVKTKHARDAVVDDAKEAPPSSWMY